MHPGQQLHTTKRLPTVPNSSQALVWATLEGALLRPEKEFASIRYHAARSSSSPVCYPLWVGRIQGEVPSARILRPLLVSPCHSDTEVRIRKCTPDDNFIRKSVFRRSQTRRKCWYGLLSNTLLLEGILSSPEKRFAAARGHASCFLSSPVCCAALGRKYSR